MKLLTVELQRDTLVIFTDGSRHRPGNRKKTGAGYTVRYMGTELRTGLWEFGRRAGVHDAEVFAFVGSAAAAAPIIATRPFIHRLIFCIDNQTAIHAITDASDHPAQTPRQFYTQTYYISPHRTPTPSHHQQVVPKSHWHPG